jgi:putative DNA primase/helicase
MDNTGVSNNSTQEPNKGVDSNETDTKGVLNLNKYVDGKIVKLNNAEMIEATSNFLLQEFKFITFRDNKDCFYYDENTGIYKSAEPFIEEKVIIYLKEDAKINMIKEITNKVKIRSYIDRDSLNHNPNIITVNNGVFNLVTDEFGPHSPDYICFSKIPVNYDPEADCPGIKHFLTEIMHEEDILAIQEMIGYCLYADYFLHKAFMLVGSGRNGKGTLLRVMEALLGEKNCVAIPLQKLTKNRFAPAKLYKKLANLCGDNSSRKIIDSDIFKTLTGEDLVFGEYKGKDGFFFKNYAKLIFSTKMV